LFVEVSPTVKENSQKKEKPIRGALFKEISAQFPNDSTRYLRVIREAETAMQDF
jgi:hypothetical protein